MENLLCHTGRVFTLDELDSQAKAAPDSMPGEMTGSPADGKENEDARLAARRTTRNHTAGSHLTSK